MFPLVHEAVASVLPPQRLRHIAFPHVEADEYGSLNEWLAAAPQATPLCGSVVAIVSINDLADRAPRARMGMRLPNERAAFRHQMDYFSHTRNARQMLERGDGANLLRALAAATHLLPAFDVGLPEAIVVGIACVSFDP